MPYVTENDDHDSRLFDDGVPGRQRENSNRIISNSTLDPIIDLKLLAPNRCCRCRRRNKKVAFARKKKTKQKDKKKIDRIRRRPRSGQPPKCHQLGNPHTLFPHMTRVFPIFQSSKQIKYTGQQVSCPGWLSLHDENCSGGKKKGLK